MNIYCTYDKVSQTYANPWFQPNDIAAMRALRMEVNRADPQNVLYHNAKDFNLMRIGDYNPETGQIKGWEPQLVVNCEKLINTDTNNKDAA